MSEKRSSSIFWFAIQFELALGVIGCAAAWLTRTPPRWVLVDRPDVWWHLLDAILSGIAAGLGLLLLLWISQHVPFQPLRNLRRIVDGLLVPLFQGAPWWELALISLAAGVGEEILFRAWLQTAIERWWQWPGAAEAGLVLAAIAFGLCHWLSATYAVVAAAIGLLLGGLFQYSGHIVAPVVAHAVYDFCALMYLLRPAGSAGTGNDQRHDPL